MTQPFGERHTVKACHVCEGTRIYYLFSAADYRVVRCEDCGLIFQNPQPGERELAEIYRADSSANEKAVGVDDLEKISRYHGAARGRLLEIGCGEGEFLATAEAAGWVVTGMEFSQSRAEKAQRLLKSGKVHHRQPHQIQVEAEQFEVCVISEVLERVHSPLEFLREVHRVLKPGGTLFVATPAMDSPASSSREQAAKFNARNLAYFDAQTLETALFKSGFREIIIENGWVAFARKVEVHPQPVLSVVVPAFNEAGTFNSLMTALLRKEIPGVHIEIIVVESNSTDGTREAALSFKNHPRVKLILEERPQGKGHAVRTGFQAATGDFLLIQDADLEYDLEDYDGLIEPLAAGRAAFVLGSRHGGRNVMKMRQFAGEHGLSVYLNFGHWFFTMLVNVLFFQRLRDPFTMFKVFRRDCLFGLEFECNRFDFDFELLIKLIRKGYCPIELPVNYRSRSFKEGKKVRMFRDPLTWLRALVRLRFVAIDPMSVAERAHKSEKLNLPE